MDLAAFATTETAEDGAAMQVRHPVTGAPLETSDGQPVTITLAGTDSDRYRRVQRAAANRRLKTQAQRRGQVTIEEIENDGLESLVACTIAWSGIVLNGEVLNCTAANARRLYKEVPAIREQVDEFVGDRANFLKASPKT